MSETTSSNQSLAKLLTLFLVIGAICAAILSSSLATPIALVLIATLIVAAVSGVIMRKKSTPEIQEDRISDPIFVNETWILKR